MSVFALMLLFSFSCQEEDEGDCFKSDCVFLWPKGKKFYFSFQEKKYIDEVPLKFTLGYEKEYYLKITNFLSKNMEIDYVKPDTINDLFIISLFEGVDASVLFSKLKKLSGVKSLNMVYKLADFIGPEMYINDEVVLRFKENVTNNEIHEMHKRYHSKVKISNSQFQIISVPIYYDPLEVANAYQAGGLTELSHPNFVSEIIINNK